jgi:hypothetical protein
MADDEFLRALGEVTAEASALEYAVAYLIKLARGWDDEAFAKILTRVGGARMELEKLHKEVESSNTKYTPLRKALVEIHERMSRALWERNRLVHSVEVLKLSGHLKDVESTVWHPKTNTTLHTNTNELEGLVRELRGIAGTALRLTHEVRSWKSAKANE